MNPGENAIAGSSNDSFTSVEVFNNYGIPAGEVIALTVVSSLISVIRTISNMLVILSVLNRQLRETYTAILLTNLSFSDLIICAVYVPMYIFHINDGSGHRFEEVRFRMEFGLFIASLNGEFSVTLDRFIAISFLTRFTACQLGGEEVYFLGSVHLVDHGDLSDPS